MKINYRILSFLLALPLITNAQLDSWNRVFENQGTGIQPVGWLEETEETVRVLDQHTYQEFSHYGEAISNILVPKGSGPLSIFRASFLFDSKEENGETFYLNANRDRNSAILFNVFDGAQNILNQLELVDSISLTTGLTGPGYLSLPNQEYWVFGNKFYYKIRWSGRDNLEVISTKTGLFGAISAAATTDDGFILCNESGYLIATDQDAEVLWSKQFNGVLTDVQNLGDGYILCGQLTDSLALIRTDTDGEILWQKKYSEGKVNSVDLVESGGFVVAGADVNTNVVLFRTDDEGNQLWSNTYGEGKGINVIESRYGGFYLQTNFRTKTQLMRVGEDGETNREVEVAGGILNVNDVVTTTSASGVLFREGNNAFYRVPKDSLTSTVFTSGLWISARDDNNDLYLSAQTYEDDWNRQDYQPGYIGADPEHFDKVWAVSKKQIELFRQDYAVPDKIAPWAFDILTWPAKGNPNVMVNQQAVDIPVDLAPFVDVNADGIYNAFDGDYPKIIGDQMLFWAMNDMPNADTEGTPLEVDIFCSMYAFSNEGVENNVPATFVDFTLINRSDRDYIDLTLGLFTDYDLGCYFDDFIGSMPDAHSVFAYNEYGIDDPGCNGVPSFTGPLPVQITSSLNLEMSSAMYMNNSALNPPPGTVEPVMPIAFDRMMHATWTDGTPLTFGGDGYNPNGGTPTPFAFPGNPSDIGAWSMCSENLLSGDRRVVMASSSNGLAKGESKRYSIGQITLGSYDEPCPDVEEYEEHTIDIRNYFNSAWPDFDLYLGPDTLLDQGASLTLDAGPFYYQYDWSTGDTTQTLLVTQPGIYSVVATTPLGFQRTDTIRIDFVTSTNELDLSAPMVFPNPTQGLVHISAGTSPLQSVEVKNVIGQSLKKVTEITHSSFQLNLSDLQTGTYILLIKGQHGEQWLRKVLLVH